MNMANWVPKQIKKLIHLIIVRKYRRYPHIISMKDIIKVKQEVASQRYGMEA